MLSGNTPDTPKTCRHIAQKLLITFQIHIPGAKSEPVKGCLLPALSQHLQTPSHESKRSKDMWNQCQKGKKKQAEGKQRLFLFHKCRHKIPCGAITDRFYHRFHASACAGVVESLAQERETIQSCIKREASPFLFYVPAPSGKQTYHEFKAHECKEGHEWTSFFQEKEMVSFLKNWGITASNCVRFLFAVFSPTTV